MTLKEKNNEIQKKNQNDLRDLEQFFNTNKVDNMLQKIEEKKKELVEEMIKYAEKNTVPCKWDKDGCPL